MAISIELLLKNLGLISSAKQSSEAVGEVADSLDAMGEAGTDAVSVAKAALEDLRRANMEQARQAHQTWGEMTEAEQNEFRKRFENAEDLQQAIADLDRERADAARRVNQDYTAEYERTFGKLETTAEDASRSVADSTEKGFDRAGSAAKDAGQTITQELGGALGSIDGTAQGAAEGALGALRGLSALIPGLGAALGAGIATLASLFVRDFFKAAEDSEKRIESMYQAMLESGANYLTEKQAQEAIIAAMQDQTMIDRARAVGEAMGIPMERAMAILVENGDEAKAVLEELNEKYSEIAGNSAIENMLAGDSGSGIWKAISALEDMNAEFDQSVSNVQSTRRALDYLATPIDAATSAAAETNAELDRMELPRAASVAVEVDLTAAERAIADWASRRRRVAVEIGIEQGGRIIR